LSGIEIVVGEPGSSFLASGGLSVGKLPEVWNRIHARRLERSHGDAARGLIGRVALLELVAPVLVRALDPFPIPVRTLDALHLASIEFPRVRQQQVELASYDARLIAVARALKFRCMMLDECYIRAERWGPPSAVAEADNRRKVRISPP
jgi:hypothetical protein